MFYDKYRHLCESRGKSPSRVALELGISKGTVSTWKNLGRTPKTEYLQKIADYFGVSVDQLLSDPDIEKAPAAQSSGGRKLNLQLFGATPRDTTRVAPLLGTVRAGMPLYAEENIECYLPIRQTDEDRYFWLTVHGDSMDLAGLEEGDQILVREQPFVDAGQMAVVLVGDDEATVKLFRQEGSLAILTPRSTNPAHQPQIYDLRQVRVRVLGRVIECRKVF